MSFGTGRACCALIAAAVSANAALLSPAAADEFKTGIARVGSGFVVVWQDGHGDIAGQRLSAAGAKVGHQFQPNASVNNLQSDPAVATLEDGTFVVVWTSLHEDPTGAIYGQRFAGGGNKLGREFRISPGAAFARGKPAVTALTGGGFVVMWEHYDNNNTSYDIYGQMFKANGHKTGKELHIDQGGNLDRFPALAALPDGGFIVVWSNRRIVARTYDRRGVQKTQFTPVGSHLGAQKSAVAVLRDGSFVVAWTWADYEAHRVGVYAQLYSADGQKAAEPVRVSPGRNASDPAIAPLARGGFVIVWDDNSRDLSGQRFTADGVADGSSFRVNTPAERGNVPYLAVTGLAKDRFAVAWEGKKAVFYDVFDAE